MAQRRIEICQEDANGVMAPVALTPTAAKTTLSFNGSGVPVINVSPGSISDLAAFTDPPSAAEMTTLRTTVNSMLAALRTANLIN